MARRFIGTLLRRILLILLGCLWGTTVLHVLLSLIGVGNSLLYHADPFLWPQWRGVFHPATWLLWVAALVLSVWLWVVVGWHRKVLAPALLLWVLAFVPMVRVEPAPGAMYFQNTAEYQRAVALVQESGATEDTHVPIPAGLSRLSGDGTLDVDKVGYFFPTLTDWRDEDAQGVWYSRDGSPPLGGGMRTVACRYPVHLRGHWWYCSW
ncbi:hypothetical protein AESSP_01167 [Aestuariimicrobium sp. T2.26MG-19.2B]|nr:hypothetical protein AESSP_01167 [Aestuariimicrobium sp. T2.26MG-19.2B]